MPPALRIRVRAHDADAPRATSWLPGPPLRLPSVLDRIAEGWWRLTPRARSGIGLLAAVATVTVVMLRVLLSPYGPPVAVLVATRDLQSGDAVGATDVAVARWPETIIPPAALAAAEELIDMRLTSGMTTGTVLTASHVRDDGSLARLASGLAAVAVPAELLHGIPVEARVDLVGVAGDGSGRTLAQDSRVLAVEGDVTWLEVERGHAADVATAALRGTLSGVVLAP